MQASEPPDLRAVLGAVKAQPGSAGSQPQTKRDGR
jgi:hypothetical protein